MFWLLGVLYDSPAAFASEHHMLVSHSGIKTFSLEPAMTEVCHGPPVRVVVNLAEVSSIIPGVCNVKVENTML